MIELIIFGIYIYAFIYAARALTETIQKKRYHLEHGTLIHHMLKDGYNVSQKGTCRGVAYMGLQEILTNNIDFFNSLLLAIKKRNGNLTQEIQSFYNGITVFQNPVDHYFLFHKDDIELDAKIRLLDLKSIPTISSIVNSIEIEKNGGLFLSDNFLGTYKPNELIKLFQSLKKILINGNSPPIGLILSNLAHCIAIGFDHSNKKWIFIDANDFPAQWINSEKSLVKKIQDAFEWTYNYIERNTITLSLSLFSTLKNKKIIKTIANEWREQTQFIRQQSFSENRCSSRHHLLLELALRGDNKFFYKELEQFVSYPYININAPVFDNAHPLYIAMCSDNIEFLEILLRHPHIDINKINFPYDSTPLNIAIEKKNTTIVKMILSHPNLDINKSDNCTGDTPLHHAIKIKNKAILKNLLSHPNIDINKLNPFLGFSPLHIAIKNGNKTIVQMLLSHPNIDINQYDIIHFTPLIMAIKESNIEIIKMLLEHEKLDVNKVNRLKNTPLIIATKKNNIEIVKMLLKHPKIDVNKANIIYKTPLMIAIKKSYIEITKMFLTHDSIDVDIANHKGQTAFYLAEKNSNVPILNALNAFKKNNSKAEMNTTCDDTRELGHETIMLPQNR